MTLLESCSLDALPVQFPLPGQERVDPSAALMMDDAIAIVPGRLQEPTAVPNDLTHPAI
jgi:hypothetical protein